MGGEYFADENGQFKMKITDGRGNVVCTAATNRVNPNQELYVEVECGKPR